MFYVHARSRNNIRLIQPTKKIIASLNGIDIKEDYFYLRNWAVSAFEKYGLNGNADGFTKNELLKSFETFNGSWVCLNHKAEKEDTDSMGENTGARYTPEDYVEIIMGIDRYRADKIRPNLERDIKQGRVTDTSMGSLAEFSVCTVCGNMASEPWQYCDHLKKDLKGRRKKGQRVKIGDRDVIIGELYFGAEFVENSIIDNGDGADMNAKIFEISASKLTGKTSGKDALFYAIREMKKEYGKLSVLSKLENAMERMNYNEVKNEC